MLKKSEKQIPRRLKSARDDKNYGACIAQLNTLRKKVEMLTPRGLKSARRVENKRLGR